MNSRLGERGNGGGFGLRVGREITPRVGAEFNLDVTSASIDLADDARAGIKASSDSFVPVFADGLLSTGPFRNVTATSEFQAATGAGDRSAEHQSHDARENHALRYGGCRSHHEQWRHP